MRRNLFTPKMSMLRGLICALVLLSCASNAAEPAATRADRFKAAYLFNFVKFVEWPDGMPQDQLLVCFLGGHGVFEALLDDIHSKKAGTRQLTAREVDASSALGECGALYIDATMAPGVAALPSMRERPILTVSDARDFAVRDGIIAMFLEGNRLRFNINIDNAQKSGLRLRSDLLQLAASVERNR
jgi:hypothetical protein